ncbi:helix-turn-helix domain-containing protein [Bdellovibrio bacteriovorus]|uniref:helix-turn-helix domain-containing protein n=1 Tax=Bdellovibrio bacteriovorus TaxID=959 RepID=UPI0035A60F64
MKKNLEAILKRRELNLNQVSKLANVPRSTIYSWTEQSSVNLAQLKAVAATLEVSLYELCFGTPDPFAISSEEILEEIFSGDVRVSIQRIKKRTTKCEEK